MRNQTKYFFNEKRREREREKENDRERKRKKEVHNCTKGLQLGSHKMGGRHGPVAPPPSFTSVQACVFL